MGSVSQGLSSDKIWTTRVIKAIISWKSKNLADRCTQATGKSPFTGHQIHQMKIRKGITYGYTGELSEVKGQNVNSVKGFCSGRKVTGREGKQVG